MAASPSPLSMSGTRYYHRKRNHTSTSEDTPRAAFLLTLQTSRRERCDPHPVWNVCRKRDKTSVPYHRHGRT
eukprot:6156534-Prymnesium_polylepis.1